MIRVEIPLDYGADYFQWLFKDHEPVFENVGQAVNYMQGYGLKDCEIATFNFIKEVDS